MSHPDPSKEYHDDKKLDKGKFIRKQYILYDGRSCGGVGSDDAQILCCASSLREARSDSKMFGDGAIYVCDIYRRNGKDWGEDEEWVEDFGI